MTVKEEAYQYLTSIKADTESYSDVILRLKEMTRKKDILSFYGSMKDLDIDAQKLRKEMEDEFRDRL